MPVSEQQRSTSYSFHSPSNDVLVALLYQHNKEAREKREHTSTSGAEKCRVSLPRCQRGLPNIVKRTGRQLAIVKRGLKVRRREPCGTIYHAVAGKQHSEKDRAKPAPETCSLRRISHPTPVQNLVTQRLWKAKTPVGRVPDGQPSHHQLGSVVMKTQDRTQRSPQEGGESTRTASIDGDDGRRRRGTPAFSDRKECGGDVVNPRAPRQLARSEHEDAEPAEGELHRIQATQKQLMGKESPDTPVSMSHPAVPPGRHEWTETPIYHRRCGTLPQRHIIRLLRLSNTFGSQKSARGAIAGIPVTAGTASPLAAGRTPGTSPSCLWTWAQTRPLSPMPFAACGGISPSAQASGPCSTEARRRGEETFYLDISSASLCGRITKIIEHYGGDVVSDLEGKVSKVITNKRIHANAKKILSSRLESSKKAEVWMRLSPLIRRALKRKIPICTAKSFVNEMRQAHLSTLNQSSVSSSNSQIRDCTDNVQLRAPYVKISNKNNNCHKPRYTQFREWPVIKPKDDKKIRTRHMRKHGKLSHFHFSKLKAKVPTFRLKRLPNGLYVPLQRKPPPLKLKIFRCRICKKLLADEEAHVIAKSHVQAVKSTYAWNELDKATEDIPNIVSYLVCETVKLENTDLKVPSSELKVPVNEASESNDSKGDVFDEFARRPISPILQMHSIEEIAKVTGFIMPGLSEEDLDMFNKLELIRKKVEMENLESSSNSSSTFDIIDNPGASSAWACHAVSSVHKLATPVQPGKPPVLDPADVQWRHFASGINSRREIEGVTICTEKSTPPTIGRCGEPSPEPFSGSLLIVITTASKQTSVRTNLLPSAITTIREKHREQIIGQLPKGHLMENTIPHPSLVIRGTYYRALFEDALEESYSSVGTRTLETTHASTLTEQGDADSSNSNVENDSYNNNTVAPRSQKRYHGSNDSSDCVFAKKMKPDDVENDMALVKCVVKTDLVDKVIDLTSELDNNWLPLDEQIQQFFLLNAEPEKVTQEKVAAVKKLAKCVKECNRKAEVYMFGSTLSKIASRNSDIDLCIIDDKKFFSRFNVEFHRKESKQRLYCYKSEFRHLDSACPLQTFNIIDATVPIMISKFRKPYYFRADISMNSPSGIRSSLLIRHYATADERFAKLAVLIKCWANKKFPGGAKHGYIGGFAWTLLLLNYMQCGTGENCPPVFPSFQDRYPSLYAKSLDEMDFEGKFPKNFVSPNKQSLSSLLYGFFYFYAYCVDFLKTMFSVRKGSILPRQPQHAKFFMYIENPINLKNVAKSLQLKKKYEQIKAEIINAYDILATTCSNFQINFKRNNHFCIHKSMQSLLAAQSDGLDSACFESRDTE
ncbi:Poly(A) RNA polymerase GLD2-A [Trichinella sp. T8]|nr:Poly(A) RNA polymerase GLD2-A [Trichinella sp. T8]